MGGGFLQRHLFHDISSKLHKTVELLGEVSSDCFLPSGLHEVDLHVFSV